MQDSKLIDLLKTFEKEDWRWFRKFLLSPYFNSREELIPFFDYLRKQAPEFDEKAIRKEKVFKKLFPKQKYNEKQISYTMNFMLTQIERFLAQRTIESQQPLLNNYLQKSLVDRQLDKHYNYQYQKSLKVLDDYKFEDVAYYYFAYQITEVANIHYANQNFRHFNQNLQDTSDTLDRFYILNKIKCCCQMLNLHSISGAEYTPSFEEEIIKFAESSKSNNHPLILIHLEVYYLLKKENADENFEFLKELLRKYNEIIPSLEKTKVYLYAINYCIVQIRKNNKRNYYAGELLKLYLSGIEKGILLNKGKLSPWTFKNVVKVGLNLKKYDFTEGFIQKYHKKLDDEFQEDALHFNLADVNYRRKNYHEAQIHLLQVQYSDIFYNLGAKTMLLKIYYETNEGDALFALIASFSIYLRRNKKITKDQREDYLNFTTILGRIVRTTKDKYPNIVEKISNTKRLNNRNWLLEICQPKR